MRIIASKNKQSLEKMGEFALNFSKDYSESELED